MHLELVRFPAPKERQHVAVGERGEPADTGPSTPQPQGAIAHHRRDMNGCDSPAP